MIVIFMAITIFDLYLISFCINYNWFHIKRLELEFKYVKLTYTLNKITNPNVVTGVFVRGI